MSTSLRAKTAGVSLGRGRHPQARKLRDAKEALYREHVIEVAERTFAEQGFGETRMQDIAAAAGVSLAKLYQIYPSKEELYRGVLVARDGQMLAAFEARWGGALRAPGSVEHVLLMMETHLHFLLDHTDYLRLQLREGYAWYASASRPTREEQRMWERGVANISAVLAWGVRQGWFTPGNAREQASLILTTQQTRLAGWVLAGMREPHEAVIARIQADFVRVCCRPAVVAKMLADDGAGLRPETQERIAALRTQL